MCVCFFVCVAQTGQVYHSKQANCQSTADSLNRCHFSWNTFNFPQSLRLNPAQPPRWMPWMSLHPCQRRRSNMKWVWKLRRNLETEGRKRYGIITAPGFLSTFLDRSLGGSQDIWPDYYYPLQISLLLKFHVKHWKCLNLFHSSQDQSMRLAVRLQLAPAV